MTRKLKAYTLGELKQLREDIIADITADKPPHENSRLHSLAIMLDQGIAALEDREPARPN